MITGSVMMGSALAGTIVWGPELMAKVIVSIPGLAFASKIACLRVPGPASLVPVTVKTAPCEHSGIATDKDRLRRGALFIS